MSMVLRQGAASVSYTHLDVYKRQGAEIVFCTGGMSVDPDDKTPLAIKNTGCLLYTSVLHLKPCLAEELQLSGKTH